MSSIPWSELAGRITHLVRQTILSTILPGLVLLVELWVVLDEPEPSSLLEGLPAVARVGLAVYFAYAIGFAARHLAFVVADARLGEIAAWFKRRGWRAGRSSSVPTSPYGVRRGAAGLHTREAFEHNLAVLRATFGSYVVNDALAAHPLGEVMKAADGAGDDGSPSYEEVFLYTKTYLRVCAPNFAVDHLEEEYNALLTAVLPIAVLPVALASHGTSRPWLAAAVVATAVVIAVLCNRARDVRCAENFLALRNLVLDARLRQGTPAP